MKLVLTIVTFLALALAARGAHGDSKIKVAVVPGIAVNLDSARVDALSQDLADALASELDITAVGGLEVRRQLPSEGLQPDCLTTPACVADVAKRLGAQQLLFVVMVDATGSGAVQVDSTWVDAATGRSVARPAIDIPTISEARPRFAAGARSLLPDAPVRPKPKTGGGIGGSMSTEVPRHFTTTTYVTAGAALVGIGVGVGFGLAARSKYNRCDETACEKSERDKIRTKTLIADTGFVVGIAGLVATSVLFATSGKESRLVVEPSPSGVAVSAVGRF
ncbi:MAG: hypothetical protein ABI867_28755 [Kofleriaceae bacterium]